METLQNKKIKKIASMRIEGILSKHGSKIMKIESFWFHDIFPLKIKIVIIEGKSFVFVLLNEEMNSNSYYRNAEVMQIPILALLQWDKHKENKLKVKDFIKIILGENESSYWIISKESYLDSLFINNNYENFQFNKYIYCFKSRLNSNNINICFSHELNKNNLQDNINKIIKEGFEFIKKKESKLNLIENSLFLTSKFDEDLKYKSMSVYESYNTLFKPIVHQWFKQNNYEEKSLKIKYLEYNADLIIHQILPLPFFETLNLISETIKSIKLKNNKKYTIIFNNNKEE